MQERYTADPETGEMRRVTDGEKHPTWNLSECPPSPFDALWLFVTLTDERGRQYQVPLEQIEALLAAHAERRQREWERFEAAQKGAVPPDLSIPMVTS